MNTTVAVTHLDFFGQRLALGDYVAFEQPSYRNLVLGRVVSFTPKQVRLVWNNPGSDPKYRHISDREGVMWERDFLTYPNTVVKRP